jgi:hypothetical protein
MADWKVANFYIAGRHRALSCVKQQGDTPSAVNSPSRLLAPALVASPPTEKLFH